VKKIPQGRTVVIQYEVRVSAQCLYPQHVKLGCILTFLVHFLKTKCILRQITFSPMRASPQQKEGGRAARQAKPELLLMFQR